MIGGFFTSRTTWEAKATMLQKLFFPIKKKSLKTCTKYCKPLVYHNARVVRMEINIISTLWEKRIQT